MKFRIENIIASVSPRWAYKRSRDRFLLNNARKYEAASVADRMDSWVAHGTSANAEISSSLTMLRNRSRQLRRDNPYANRAVQIITSNVIGYGIMTTLSAKRANAMFKEWAESKDCDFEGKCNLYGLQEQVMDCVVDSGEALIMRHWVKGKKVPLQLQVLEPDYIDTSKDVWLNDGKRVVQGIQFDKYGRKEGYWLFEQHSGDINIAYGRGIESKFVKASEIIHVMRQDRIGQARGVPWGAPIMVRLKDLDAYEDAQLLRQKIAACFAAFVHDADPDDPTVNGKYELSEKLDPATIQFLPAGQTISFANPPATTGYSEYMNQMLHSVAIGYGITFESLTGDYSQVNFTSGRMGRIDFFNNLDKWQWNMFIPQFCEGVFGWAKEAMTLAGMNMEGVTAKYTPPKRMMTDPTKEIPSIIKAIRAGITTLPATLREAGENPEEVLNEIAETNALLDKLAIKLDTDPRQTTQQGQNQMENTNG